jgi:hypothetical protein
VPPNALPAHAWMPCRAVRPPAAVLAVLLLSACGLPERANPINLFREVTGATLDDRLPPPGLDQPTPNLASVPPVPNRPDAATRAAILRGLEGARDAAATPLPEGRPDAPPALAAMPGAPPIAAAPPGPPRLSRAPSVPWGAVSVRAAGQGRGADMPPPALRPEPGAPPPPPAPELLAPAPPAAAPPPPPPRELLAP